MEAEVTTKTKINCYMIFAVQTNICKESENKNFFPLKVQTANCFTSFNYISLFKFLSYISKLS